MQHKGEILERVVRSKSNNLTALGHLMGYDRSTLYRHFTVPDLEDGIIIKYAQALKYDFSFEFPDLIKYNLLLEEPLVDYKPITLSEALKETDKWKAKYIDLLERYNDMLKGMVGVEKG